METTNSTNTITTSTAKANYYVLFQEIGTGGFNVSLITPTSSSGFCLSYAVFVGGFVEKLKNIKENGFALRVHIPAEAFDHLPTAKFDTYLPSVACIFSHIVSIFGYLDITFELHTSKPKRSKEFNIVHEPRKIESSVLKKLLQMFDLAVQCSPQCTVNIVFGKKAYIVSGQNPFNLFEYTCLFVNEIQKLSKNSLRKVTFNKLHLHNADPTKCSVADLTLALFSLLCCRL